MKGALISFTATEFTAEKSIIQKLTEIIADDEPLTAFIRADERDFLSLKGR